MLRITLAAMTMAVIAVTGHAQQTAEQLAPAEWRKADAAGLTQIARHVLAGRWESVDPTPELAQYLALRVEQDAAKAGANLDGWFDALRLLGPKLSSERRKHLFELCKNLYTPDDATVVACSFARLHSISEVFVTLGQEQYKYQLIATWVNGSDKYEELSAQDLRVAARAISQATGTNGKSARQRLASWLESKYFGDAAAMKALGLSMWKDFARYLLHDLGGTIQGRWADKLVEVFARDAAAVRTLTAQDMADLVFTLDRLLAAGDRAKAMLSTWVNANPKVAAWAPGTLNKTIPHLAGIQGEDGITAKTIFADYVATEYLRGDSGYIRIKPADWVKIAQVVGAYLPAEAKALLKSKLRAAYVTAEAVATMKSGTADGIAQALKAVGDADAGAVQVMWLLDTAAGKATGGKALVEQVKRIAASGVSETTMDRLLGRLEAQQAGETVTARSVTGD